MNRRSLALATVMALGCCRSASAWVYTWPIYPNTITGQTAGKIMIKGKVPEKTKMDIRLDPGLYLGGDSNDIRLLIYNSDGGTQCFAFQLPPAGFVPQTGRFIYRDKQRALGPLTRAFIDASGSILTLRASASQPVDYNLIGAPQGSVAVKLTDRLGRMCPADCSNGCVFRPCSTDADCGGVPGSCQESTIETCENFINPVHDRPVLKNRPGLFLSKTAEALTVGSSCPTLPPGCSPSGAFLDPVD